MSELYCRIKSGSIKVNNSSPSLWRFWKNVDRDEGPIHPVYGQCWQWIGSRSPRGYGQIASGKKHYRAHRWAYQEFVGPLDNMLVCHHCDNPSCVNPAHLFLGMQLDNQKDMTEKNRQAKGEKNGWAELTERIVLLIRSQWAKRRGRGDPVYGQSALARRFNTTQRNISYIVCRKHWKHI